MRLRVYLVEDDYEGKLGLVEYAVEYERGLRCQQRNIPACIEHIRHKRRRGCGTWCVDDVCDDGWNRRGNCVCDNSTRRGPRKYLDLARRVYDHIAGWRGKQSRRRQTKRNSLNRLCTFLNEIEDLVEFCGEEIERGEDSTIWAEVIPLEA